VSDMVLFPVIFAARAPTISQNEMSTAERAMGLSGVARFAAETTNPTRTE